MDGRSVKFFIKGKPLTKRAGSSGLAAWKQDVIHQTEGLQVIVGPCEVIVRFHLSQEAYDTAPPYGSDLDNLLKPLMDGLKATVLAPDDQRVVAIHVSKAPPTTPGEPGVHVEIRQAESWSV